jgi:glycosyltransferase involved in cell wall biosynthesis
MARILVVEPYYGGSHKLFLDGLRRFVKADYTLLSLPARKWKMRMQLSAPWFIGQISALKESERCFDTVLFSSFIDVSVFKALASTIPGWNPDCRYLVYFHENQFAYPNMLAPHTSHQFTAVNFTTALAADSIAFNSNFNRNSFISHCRNYLGKATDMDLLHLSDILEDKSRVLYPGLDFSQIDAAREVSRDLKKNGPPLIIWNHRWEHDKNPEAFFTVLGKLQEAGIDFRLCVLGQRFQTEPVCFKEARQEMKSKILQFGYVENRADYYQMLVQGDIVVSTARHEFFGISIVEAVRAGCLPVVPNRLAYPELFGPEFVYEEGGLFEHLVTIIRNRTALPLRETIELTESYSWRTLGKMYQHWLS